MREHVCTRDNQGAHGVGTNCCYTLCRCRCYPCAFEANAYRSRLLRDGPRMVDAEPVRKHVRSLMCKGGIGAHHKGVGLKRIAQVSGVSHGALWKLVYGAPDRKGPSRKVRRATADALLAVSLDDMADGVTVPAGEARRQVDAMVEGGFSKAELARYLTGDPNRQALQHVQSGRVTVGAARKVDELYRRWKAGEIAPRGRWSRHFDGDPPVTPMETSPEVIGQTCEDCGAPSLAGGRWCWPCFRVHADRSAA